MPAKKKQTRQVDLNQLAHSHMFTLGGTTKLSYGHSPSTLQPMVDKDGNPLVIPPDRPVTVTIDANDKTGAFLTAKDLQNAARLFSRAGITLNQPNGGGTKMAKAKPGDQVVLLKDRGGGVPTGETGRVMRVDTYGFTEDEYVVDFPQQKAYRLRAEDFEVAAVQKIEAQGKVDFDSVILDDHKKEQILEALDQLQHTDLIFRKWGFGKTFEKGRGISMLFYGEPGTGKTLMAQAIADRLGYVLKVIATAEIESSEPGQAERNIRAHFEGQGGKKTVLLFDECDSLIYDRTNLGSILGAQVNELLSSLEKFDGVTIFTTNRLEKLDEAVNRRLSLKLEFGLPNFEQRIGIWQRLFPKECPLDPDVDWNKLAKVEIAGGYIKNSVLRAARMAASEKVPDREKKIGMRHLIKGLKLEVEAMMEFQAAKKKDRTPRLAGSHTQDFEKDKFAGLTKKADIIAAMEAEEDEQT